jgi:acyl carrier protein
MIAASERDSLIDQVTAVVRRSAKIPGRIAITAESRLVEDLAIDSLDLVSLVLQLQDDFDVVFEEDAVPNLCRVADIVEHLKQSGGRRLEGGGGWAVGTRSVPATQAGTVRQWRTLQDAGVAGVTD